MTCVQLFCIKVLYLHGLVGKTCPSTSECYTGQSVKLTDGIYYSLLPEKTFDR